MLEDFGDDNFPGFREQIGGDFGADGRIDVSEALDSEVEVAVLLGGQYGFDSDFYGFGLHSCSPLISGRAAVE
jgi:hypothetical protein